METVETCFRNEDIQELSDVNTERPEVRVREVDKVNITKSGPGRNLALDQEEEEEEEEEDIVTRADLAKIVSSHMQTIFRQLSDIDQRLNHIENQWNLKKNKKNVEI